MVAREEALFLITRFTRFSTAGCPTFVAGILADFAISTFRMRRVVGVVLPADIITPEH